MSAITRLKLGLAIVGLFLFAAGARYDSVVLRWAAIGIIAIAFLLRFVNRDGQAP